MTRLLEIEKHRFREPDALARRQGRFGAVFALDAVVLTRGGSEKTVQVTLGAQPSQAPNGG